MKFASNLKYDKLFSSMSVEVCDDKLNRLVTGAVLYISIGAKRKRHFDVYFNYSRGKCAESYSNCGDVSKFGGKSQTISVRMPELNTDRLIMGLNRSVFHCKACVQV